MWNSLGSLRDRVRENAIAVRENAKAAAVVAQGVLQAAAAEDDGTNAHAQGSPSQILGDGTQGGAPLTEPQDDWGDWDEQTEANGATDNGGFFGGAPLTGGAGAEEVALDAQGSGGEPVPPPPMDVPDIPPPPPDVPDVPPPPPEDAGIGSFNTRRTRPSRYVAGNKPAARMQVPGPVVPRPSIFASLPAHTNGEATVSANEELVEPTKSTEPTKPQDAAEERAGWDESADSAWNFGEENGAAPEGEAQPLEHTLPTSSDDAALGAEGEAVVDWFSGEPTGFKAGDTVGGQNDANISDLFPGGGSRGVEGPGAAKEQPPVEQNIFSVGAWIPEEPAADVQPTNVHPGPISADYPKLNEPVADLQKAEGESSPFFTEGWASSAAVNGVQHTGAEAHESSVDEWAPKDSVVAVEQTGTEPDPFAAVTGAPSDPDSNTEPVGVDINSFSPGAWAPREPATGAQQAEVESDPFSSTTPTPNEPVAHDEKTEVEPSPFSADDWAPSDPAGGGLSEEIESNPFSSNGWSQSSPVADVQAAGSGVGEASGESETFAAAIGFGEEAERMSSSLTADDKPRSVQKAEETSVTQGTIPNFRASVESQDGGHKVESEFATAPLEDTRPEQYDVSFAVATPEHDGKQVQAPTAELRNRLRKVTLDRDEAIVAKESGDRLNDDLEASMLQLREDFVRRTEDLDTLRRERNELQQERNAAIEEKRLVERERDAVIEEKLLVERERDTVAEEMVHMTQERDAVVEEKLLVERERDAAIERGGDGIREARNVIEVMRNGQDVAEKREAVISEQLVSLRSDLDRIAQERNSFIAESDELKEQLKESEAQARLREDSLSHEIRVLRHENEVAKLEREQAITASQIRTEEHQELLESEQAKSSSIAGYEAQIRELQAAGDATHREREEESQRIEALSNLMEEMKERTRSVLSERNDLYDQKLSLEKEVEDFYSREEQAKRQLLDSQRETVSVAGERDEARQRYASMREQFKDISKSLETVSTERDRLVQERTASAAGSDAFSENEKALVAECQQKTAAVAHLQRKLTSAAAKIEKLTTQRGTFQRQRDEAGARLRAAGAEFASLNAKLTSAIETRDRLQVELVDVRKEKDIVLARVEGLSEVVAQKKIAEDSAEALGTQLDEARGEIQTAREELNKLSESRSIMQQKCVSLESAVTNAQNKCNVAIRERDLLQSQQEVVSKEKETLQVAIAESQNSLTEVSKQSKALQLDLATTKEKLALDIGIVKAELAAEQKIRSEMAARASSLQSSLDAHRAAISEVRTAAATALSSGKTKASQSSTGRVAAVSWPSVPEVNHDGDGDIGRTVAFVSSLCSLITELCAIAVESSADVEELETQHAKALEKIDALERESTTSTEKDQQLEHMQIELGLQAQRAELLEREKMEYEVRAKELKGDLDIAEMRSSELESIRIELGRQTQRAELLEREKSESEALTEELRNDLDVAEMRSSELQDNIQNVTQQLTVSREEQSQRFSEQSAKHLADIEKLSGNLKSIWTMLQRCLASQQIEDFSEGISDDEDCPAENIAVRSLRAAASVVAEMERNRQLASELQQKLAMAEAEVVRLIDRSEMAEQERDAAKSSNERLERKANVAHAEGAKESKQQLEEIISQMQDSLEDLRDELRHTTEKASRCETESGELRALCSKLTSQLNGRTNELDDAEEKVVYLQDQVTTLEEDLEEAHRSLKQREADSANARRSDVDRLTAELEEAIAQVENLERECAKLREACDAAETSAREAGLLSETHRTAEENLQIAIEQLEAEQESAVMQRTIELQKKLEEAEAECEVTRKREEALNITENKLNIRDDEIKELRGALGRLADERVELKLELEKSLSRLNHPDAGGQLVDRRVVRQLLVSYFRVGSVRRRDVLELMSRMLAFSESDNVAVGLKRRALMDRIGSLVQAPELDNASLPPIGTVSDKWIEFLMKETEEGEEQARGW